MKEKINNHLRSPHPGDPSPLRHQLPQPGDIHPRDDVHLKRQRTGRDDIAERARVDRAVGPLRDAAGPEDQRELDVQRLVREVHAGTYSVRRPAHGH